MRIAIVVNNTAALTPTWTTIHLIDAFLRAGHQVRLIEALELDVLQTGQLQGRAWCLDCLRYWLVEMNPLSQNSNFPRFRLYLLLSIPRSRQYRGGVRGR